MAELTEQMKRAVIVAFAQYRTPTEVAAMLQEQYGVSVTIQQMVKYDPARPTYEAGLAWVEVFETVRETYTKDTAAIPSANQSWRINELQDMYREAKKGGKLSLAAGLLEQIAKEVGGVLTNERNINVEKTERGFRGLTSTERRDTFVELIRDALTNPPEQTAPTSEKMQ